MRIATYKFSLLLLATLLLAQPGVIPLDGGGVQRPSLKDVRPEDRGLIEGRVINSVTGAPVAKASVNLNWMGGGGLALRTDADGKFRAEQMAPGQYYPLVQAAGFIAAAFDGTNPVRLAPGGSNRAVTIKLTPQAVITGRVLDEDGDPVANAQVVAASRRRRNAQGAAGYGTTNDLGEFRIAGMAAGKYAVSASALLHQMQNGPSPSLMATATTASAPILTFYPSEANLDSATVLTLTPGATQGGVDIRLRKSMTVMVSGKVDYQKEAGVSAHISLQLAPAGGMDMFRPGNHVSAQPDGGFQFPNVTPGQHILLAQVSVNKPGAPNIQLTSRTPVQVANADVAGLVITPRAPVSVSGKVMNAGAETDLSKMMLTLVPQGSDPGFGIAPGQAKVNRDGRFVALSVTPGFYRLDSYRGSEDHYLRSAIQGGSDLLKNGLDLAASPLENIEITIASDGGTIEGVLEDTDMPPGTMALVALWPAGERKQEIHRKMLARAEAGNAYALSGVPPGEYKIAAFAVTPRDSGLLQSLDFLRELDSLGEAITVKAHAKLTKALKLRRLPDE